MANVHVAWLLSLLMNKRSFLSLRFKLLVMLLALSLPISLLFGILFYHGVTQQYEQARHGDLAQYARQVNGLILQQRQHLQQVAILQPALCDVRQYLLKGDWNGFKKRFEDFWSFFQLDMGLADVRYYDLSGNELAAWGNQADRFDVSNSAVRMKNLQWVIEHESPLSFIDCIEACRIHAIAPVLLNGRLSGLFAVSASLAETVLAFRHISPIDIVILTQTKEGKDAIQKNWGLRIEATSNPKISQALLQLAAVQFSLERLLTSSIRIDWDDQTYELTALALDMEQSGEGMRLLAVENISSKLQSSKSMARQIFIMSVISTLLILALLYRLLGRSLKRLQHIAQSIPLLGERAFQALRQAIKPRGGGALNDEIDLLDMTAIRLSYRLEDLEHEVSERARLLKDSMFEIAKEKAFIESLLNHAQALIVTSDSNGRLLSLNRYAEALSGFSQAELLGKFWVGSFLIEAVSEEVSGRLKALAFGASANLRHEARLHCRDGEYRYISWVHTHLQGGGSAALLSLGLDISDRIQYEARLGFLVDHDPLTACFNRKRFLAELARMLDTAQHHALEGALLHLNLTRFKYLNDICGHSMGDNLLLRVRDELRKCLQSSDILGRLGGDEFAIALLDADAIAAIGMAKTINRQLASIVMPDLAIRYRISASIGIALFPKEAIDATNLMINADIAMSQAKEEGHIGWHVFSQEEKARERLRAWVTWEERIKRGMAEDRFILHFQPVMNIAEARIVHYEVLLRLRLDDGSLAMPDAFLSVAERNGMIHDLDLWVVRHALETLARQSHRVLFAINLSGASIGDVQFLEALRQILFDSKVDPAWVVFEITETAAVADLSMARDFIAAIKALGCAFSLDDFGSGFASFYYLKHFSVDYVKIDGSFIRNFPDNLDDQIFVRAMVEIARAYGKKTVAEFVENEETLALLRDYGVDYAQGYYIGKPQPSILI